MAKKDDRLIVYEKIYKLLHYTYNLLTKYPKSERFTTCTGIKNLEIKCLEDVMFAWKTPDLKAKYKYLSDADVRLFILKTFTRMSYELKFISDKNYTAWDNQIDEIGKMIGAWMKKCRGE